MNALWDQCQRWTQQLADALVFAKVAYGQSAAIPALADALKIGVWANCGNSAIGGRPCSRTNRRTGKVPPQLDSNSWHYLLYLIVDHCTPVMHADESFRGGVATAPPPNRPWTFISQSMDPVRPEKGFPTVFEWAKSVNAFASHANAKKVVQSVGYIDSSQIRGDQLVERNGDQSRVLWKVNWHPDLTYKIKRTE